MKKNYHKTLQVIAISYLILLIGSHWFLLPVTPSEVNLIPLKSIYQHLFLTHEPMLVWKSFIWFVPLGIYLLALPSVPDFTRSIKIVGIISLLVQLGQFIWQQGYVNIDDFLLNLLGGVVGFTIYTGIWNYNSSREKAKKIITLLSLFVGLPTLFMFITYYLTK